MQVGLPPWGANDYQSAFQGCPLSSVSPLFTLLTNFQCCPIFQLLVCRCFPRLPAEPLFTPLPNFWPNHLFTLLPYFSVVCKPISLLVKPFLMSFLGTPVHTWYLPFHGQRLLPPWSLHTACSVTCVKSLLTLTESVSQCSEEDHFSWILKLGRKSFDKFWF